MAALCASAALAGDHDEAVRLYKEANAFFDQGKFADAAAAYGRSLDEDSNLLGAFYNRALADEMVDHRRALEGWKKFMEAAREKPEAKWDAARAQARMQLLASLPEAPALLAGAKYQAGAGDYYPKVGQASEGEQWRSFPLKVYLGNAPTMKWQEGAREAYDAWAAVFPLQLVAAPEGADIRLDWEDSTTEPGRAGEEADWVQFHRARGGDKQRRVAVIIVDLSRRWTKEEMRGIMLHEIGHALGIKEHSDSKQDVMFFELQEKYHRVVVPVLPTAIYWKSLPKQPSRRDVNTLIRLYNSAGWGERMR